MTVLGRAGRARGLQRMMGRMLLVEGLEGAREAFAGRGGYGAEGDLRAKVAQIVEAVRTEGDAAVRRFSQKFDGTVPDGWRVPAAAFDDAERSVPPEIASAMRLAASRIRTFYEAQPRGGFLSQGTGELLGQLVRPLERVACYVPGGTAPLFSTLLMSAVPARVAGVEQVVAASPPRRDGSVAPEILLAARVAGVSEVYRLGGAQAVAALAFGTATVPRVDKVVGPGNRFVVLAKQMVFGAVGIEALPGPTETLVLADETAEPHFVAADLLAQAEHVGAQPVLVTPSRVLVEAVRAELDRQLPRLRTEAAARESLEARGVIVVVKDLEEGLEVANFYAPEHLCLLVHEPWALVAGVKNAGGIFVGEHSMEALGDYVAGPSHVMPTGGTARFASALNLRDFQRVIPLVHMGPRALEQTGPAAAALARAEGLEAHATAIEARLHRG